MENNLELINILENDEEVFMKIVYKLIALSPAELQTYKNRYRTEFSKLNMPDIGDIFYRLCEAIMSYKLGISQNLFYDTFTIEKIASGL